MYTQCPQCLTVFTLDAATLAMAHGCVGCGQCGATFDTIATLTDELPEGAFETLPLNDPSPAPPLLVQQIEHALPAQHALFEEIVIDSVVDRAEGIEAAEPQAGEDEVHALSPAFHRRPQMHDRLRRRLQVACAALALLLGLQLAWAERATPPLRGVCAALGCPLPPVKDLAKLELLSRDIRRHPSVADALMISATLRNDAAFRQPYPIVTITLSDLDDNRIAMRRFRPAEYLHDEAARQAGLAPGASAALVFEVHDPGQNAVAFEFSFE